MSDVVNAASIQASPRPRGRKRAPRGLLVAAGLCALLVLMPLAFTVYRAVTYGWDDALELIFRPLVGELLINTLSITISATLVSAVVGTAYFWNAECRMPQRCVAPMSRQR